MTVERPWRRSPEPPGPGAANSASAEPTGSEDPERSGLRTQVTASESVGQLEIQRTSGCVPVVDGPRPPKRMLNLNVVKFGCNIVVCIEEDRTWSDLVSPARDRLNGPLRLHRMSNLWAHYCTTSALRGVRTN